MKVLFAVSNEEISESIVKKYQKEYKQIISYKNVYYFNAILKELQKDKNYDRIVISEDLEAFAHTQYEQIDKFIFEKLDSISDEAANNRGNDIPIILIASDRREKSEEMLVKLFGIGVYNAIIGADRSVDEVCKLINRPRSKKEAKTYYKIDSDNVSYQSENENDVSEMEMQNILAHYKRLGENEAKYVESYDNIAAQYNDAQLRIISKTLPLNVRAVLEEKSPKYQQIMSFNSRVSDKIRVKKEVAGPSEKLLISKSRIQKKPTSVVIPTAVDMNSTKKLTKPKKVEQPKIEELEIIEEIPEKPVVQTTVAVEEPVKKRRGRPRKNPLPEETSAEPQVKKKRGRPRKNQLPEELDPIEDIDNDEEVVLPGFEEDDEDVTLPGFEEETTLPGLEESSFQEDVDYDDDYDGNSESSTFQNEEDDEDDEVMLPGFNSDDNDEDDYNEIQQNTGFYNNTVSEVKKPKETYTSRNQTVETVDLSYLMSADKKIVTFVGTSKNGTSFIVNNLAELLSSSGVNTAILDTTKNRNSYYIYTKNEEELRNTATHSIRDLANGIATGIQVNRNLTVYTSLPDEGEDIINVDRILETLLKNHSLILIDTDFETPMGYFVQSKETYLVQSVDILTIQPLTAFLRELKARNVLDERKLRVILNKTVRVRGITDKTIIGGMAFYNDPAMSFMTELFDRTMMKYVTIPFEEETYTRYLENVIECNISLKGYSKMFMQSLKELSGMVYPVSGNYVPPSANTDSGFNPSINNTLNQMRNRY